MIFFVLFVVIPIIEIALFISVGDEIGILNTLLLTVVTAIIGAFLVRTQGLATLLSARASMAQNELPVKEMFDGICLAIAGAMLMTPGFFTDTLGFSLLIPPFREFIRKELPKHIDIQTMSSHSMGGGMGGMGSNDPRYRQDPHRTFRDPDVIDAEYERVDDTKNDDGDDTREK